MGENEQTDICKYGTATSGTGGQQGKTIRPSGPGVSSFEDGSFHSRRHPPVADSCAAGFLLPQGLFPIGQRYR